MVPFPECHTVGITEHVDFSDWLISLNSIHLSFFYVFSWLDSSFPLVLNTIPLSGWTAIYLSVHLLRDTSVASKFRQSRAKRLKTSACSFLCTHKSAGEDSWEPLEQHGDQTSQSKRKSTLNIPWRDWGWSWRLQSFGEEPTHWKRPWCWERLEAEEDETVGMHHWLDGHEFE